MAFGNNTIDYIMKYLPCNQIQKVFGAVIFC